MARSWSGSYGDWEDGFEDDTNLVRMRRKTHFEDQRGGSRGRRPQKQKNRRSHHTPRAAH